MTNTKELDEILDRYSIIDTSHLYHHEHDQDELKSKLAKYIAKECTKARIDELEALNIFEASLPIGSTDMREIYADGVKRGKALGWNEARKVVQARLSDLSNGARSG